VRLRRTWVWLVLLSTAAVLAAILIARRQSQQAPDPRASAAAPQPVSTDYVDSSACAPCHDEIARTYSLTGMARGFSRVRPGVVASAAQDFSPAAGARVYHKPSDRYYTMFQRNGTLYQRRHQIGFDGKETNVLEVAADYVVGSGNHARTFLHRNADGRLVQLPVSWYAGEGQAAGGEGHGFWAMSPGYDKPAHLDFRRVIDAGCMACHNGYPRAPVKDDLEGPRFAGALPEGIDCQRCHGPGRAHIEAINTRDLEAARRAIVNPAKLDRERQLETCMQCHLESTSSPLPFQIRRAEHPPFSYAPGKPLSDYFIHFDHAAGAGHDDKFEIASGAYRLRKSACFLRSQMTCGTCHDPHDIPRGAAATQHYVTVCKTCHAGVHTTETASPKRSDGGCIGCHMPKRRAEDAVHVVVTDHYIQRQKPRRDLLAKRTEAENARRGEYRGEVVLYYPPHLPATPDNDLYLAVAQVQQGSNVSAGIRRLQQAIETHRPTRADFYFELARAYSRIGDIDADIRWCREALRRDSGFVPALKELASAAAAKGDLAESSRALEQATALRPDDGNALADLGNVYLKLGRVEDAQRTLQRALALEATTPQANNTMGLTVLRTGAAEVAEAYFREAIRLQPDLAEAHNNLGNLLAGRHAYAEARHHFEQAIRSDPNYIDAHHSYGVVLALTGARAEAIAALRAAIALAPDRPQVRVDLADVLAAVGRVNDAAREYEIAAQAADPDARAAAQAGLRALGR
jgi:tetratricopeptide (TPR) repeat protein